MCRTSCAVGRFILVVTLVLLVSRGDAENLTAKEIEKLCSSALLEVESTLPDGRKVLSTGINVTPGGLFLTTGAFVNAKMVRVRSTRKDTWSIPNGLARSPVASTTRRSSPA